MPWVIMDFKGDELLGLTEYVKDLIVTDHIPHEPGLYRMKPVPVAEDDISSPTCAQPLIGSKQLHKPIHLAHHLAQAYGLDREHGHLPGNHG